MMAMLWFLMIMIVVTAAGRQVAAWLRLPADATLLERNLVGFAIGLGVLAYGILLIGLAGWLRPAPVMGFLLVLALLGVLLGQEGRAMRREFIACLRAVSQMPRWGWGVSALFGVFAVVSLFGVYTPPTSGWEWDSLAYHLADPKIYVQHHRIFYIPWEDHSNFAFTAEMWYTLGLLLNSVALAKWFHFSCGVGACLATYALGARHLAPRVGLWAAGLLASMPLVFWEAGTAYSDLATTFYTMVTLLAVANGVRLRDERWLRVAAVLLGLTLSTKATALTTVGLLTLGLLIWRIWVRRESVGYAVRRLALWSAIAFVVGSPWFIKSAIYTGNPVYPFYFQIFGGRYWTQENSQAYDQSNAAFGVGRGPAQAVLVPWNLTMNLLPGHPLERDKPNWSKQSFYDRQNATVTLSPVLLTALFFPLLGLGRIPSVIRWLAAYALGAGMLWFVMAQYVRYLLPIVPVLCLLAAWVLDGSLAWRRISGYALAGLAGVSLLFSLTLGAMLVAVQAPVVLGTLSSQAYLAANELSYPAMQFVNTQLPLDSRLVFYGNPLGFYCDRPYLWGERGHGRYIPYERFRSAEDLNRYLRSQGITHILINSTYFPLANGTGYTGWVYQLTAGGPNSPLFVRNGIFIYALPTQGESS